MKIKAVAGFLVGLVLLFVSSYQFPIVAQDEPAKQKHFKGRVAPSPEKLAALHAAALRRHGEINKRLPKVTAASWDCRTLGQVPPIVDQGSCGSCFKGDVMIRMADGTYQRIDQVKVGDFVVSAEGRSCRVAQTMRRQVDEPLSRIVIAGHCELEATREHPILTEQGYFAIGELHVGQFVAIPRFLPGSNQVVMANGALKRPLVNPEPFFPFGDAPEVEGERLELNHRLGRLIGLYVAEGTASANFDRKLIWSLSIKEVDTFAKEIVELCRSELGADATIELLHDRGGCKVKLNSSSLARQFAAWFGSGPAYKTVPSCFMSANEEFLRGMLSGWIDGDRQRGESAVTVSPVLALQMHDIANYLGYMPSLIVHTQPKLDSRGTYHLRSWRVAMNNPETYKRGAAKQTETHLWRKVTAIGEGKHYRGYVYNLEIDGDHSYVANGIGVHNCWDFSGTSICTSAFIKAGYAKPDGSFALSEQYTLDCGSNGGCNGDDNTTVTDWAKKTGLPLTSDYGPYKARAGQCKSGVKLYKIEDWGFCTPGGGQTVSATQDIKNSMVAFGPIGCAVAAGGSSFWNSGQGTDTGHSNSIDHDVVLVGWDDNHDCGDGSKGAWIMRNSWGTGWGTGGYAWMKYGADSIGTEAIWATATPIVSIPVISSPITASGIVGAPFTYQIVASGSPTLYSATGLADGLTCNVTTGFISGAPTTAGKSAFTVDAANAAGTGSESVLLTITDAIPPVPPPTPPPLPGAPAITSPLTLTADIGSTVKYRITATNDPLILDVASALPAGWTCALGGLITGTMKTAKVSITLLAANAVGSSTAVLVVKSNVVEATITLTAEQVQAVLDAQGAKQQYEATPSKKRSPFKKKSPTRKKQRDPFEVE